MGKRGPAPKPTALKKLQGNPGRRPLGAPIVPEDDGKPQRPSWLGDDAATVWNYLIPRLYKIGLLTKLDRELAGALCEEIALYQQAVQKLQEDEVKVVYRNNKGNYFQNPWMYVKNRALDNVMRLASRFGITPADRVKFEQHEMEQEVSLSDELFAVASQMEQGD